MAKTRVLFFAEPATLAHVVRPVVLAGTLDRGHYDVDLATGPDFRFIATEAGIRAHDLFSIGTKAYLAAVAAGRPVFPYRVLERYVEDDLRVIAELKPDIIVGDFRLSLAVSARLAHVPYVAISNAYWSPYATAEFSVPVHSATRLLGVAFSNWVFNWARPAIFAQHAMPMHRLRRKHGMPSLGFDLRQIFTEGDVTVFADAPEVVPTSPAQPADRYHYIGPVVWSPSAPIPEAVTKSTDSRRWIYVALGSSGDDRLLETIVDAIVTRGCRAIIVARDGSRFARFGDTAVVAPMLPGNEVAALAEVVVCNGGSPGTHQALLQGTPVLGIPANLDQLLNMEFLCRTGAAAVVRADNASPRNIGLALDALLQAKSYEFRARQVQDWLQRHRASTLVPKLIAEMAGRPFHS